MRKFFATIFLLTAITGGVFGFLTMRPPLISGHFLDPFRDVIEVLLIVSGVGLIAAGIRPTSRKWM